MNQKLREQTDSLLAREKGTVYKDHGGKISIALIYPNTYHVGMSNLGFQGIYGILNDMKDVVCERVFLPEDHDIQEYIRTNTEIFSMESKKTLAQFDIIAFSVSFENDYPNIVTILELAKIPFRAEQRDNRHPLMIMGGVCAFFNPEPIAEFFDICFIGEGDELISEFISIYKTSTSRDEVLKKSLTLEGIYVPKFYNISYGSDGMISSRNSSLNVPATVRRRKVENISKAKIHTIITTPEAAFSEMYLVEAMRGCQWNCRFCVASRIYNPPRKRELESIRQEIMDALSKTKRVGLIGPSLSDYPHIKDVLEIPGVEFSITSLRASKKSAELVGLMKGHKSISIAPEAGTERLRRVINKKITEEEILYTAKLLFEKGLETLRLYFMVGLPTETRQDIDGLINLVKKIRDVFKKGAITLSISTFVPKPFTPFQWHPMERPNEVKERLKIIKKAVQSIRGARAFHDVPKYAYMQGLFSVGDRRISRVLEGMSNNQDWMKAAQAAGINKDRFIFRNKDISEILPWDFIDMGISKEALWSEYRQALTTG